MKKIVLAVLTVLSLGAGVATAATSNNGFQSSAPGSYTGTLGE